MDAGRMSKSLARIAHEILERNASPSDVDALALVGIRTRGVPIARRIAAAIHGINGHEIPTGSLDITLYRDDLMRHAVGPQPLSRRTEIPCSIADTGGAVRGIGQRPSKNWRTMLGQTVFNLFYEPSTRTRTSFEIAEKRLSADTLNIAVAASSVLKGETLVDTAMNIEAMAPDVIVMRHASSGACQLLADVCKSRIINAGDGMHEHPTQALLDAFTIREHKKDIAGLKIAIVGDLLHSRVLRSNALLLTKLGAELWVCGPPTLVPPGIECLGVPVTTSVEEAVRDADVIMMLRIQQERMQGAFFPSLREYFNVFGMTTGRVKLAKPDVIIMHPGPMNRGVESASAVADGPYSVILEQVANGVAVRMAVLYLLAGGVEDEAAA